MNLFSLRDEIAFVTGAGSGIGQGIAIGLAEAGADVALVRRACEQRARGHGKAIAGQGPARADQMTGDVVDAAALTAAVEGDRAELWPADARGELRRHRQRRAGRGHAARTMEADDRRQPDGRLPVLSGGGPGDARPRSAARSSISLRCPDRSSIVA